MIKKTFTSQRGFSMVELLVAMAIASVMLTGVFSAFLQTNKSYRVQEEIGEMQQTARAVMATIQGDMALARHGAPDDETIALWLATSTVNPNMNANPTLVDGGDGWPVNGVGGTLPDTLTYLWADPDEMVPTTVEVLEMDNTFTVADGSLFANAAVKVFFMGEFVCGNVNSVSGGTVTVGLSNNNGGGGGGGGGGPGKKKKANSGKTFETLQNNRFAWSFPVDTMVGPVRQVTYAISTLPPCPNGTTCLMRKSGKPGEQFVVVAYEVENFQIVDAWATGGVSTNPVPGTSDIYLVAITVRTPHQDGDYTDPVTGDGYRRITFQAPVTIPNPGTLVF